MFSVTQRKIDNIYVYGSGTYHPNHIFSKYTIFCNIYYYYLFDALTILNIHTIKCRKVLEKGEMEAYTD